MASIKITYNKVIEVVRVIEIDDEMAARFYNSPNADDVYSVWADLNAKLSDIDEYSIENSLVLIGTEIGDVSA